MIDTFAPHDGESYEDHVSALEVPEEVRGYREVRYPKMENARKKVEALLRSALKFSRFTSHAMQITGQTKIVGIIGAPDRT